MDKKRLALLLGILIAIIAAAVFVFLRYFSEPEPTPTTPIVTETPPTVIEPDITNIEDAEQFTEGKPLPEATNVSTDYFDENEHIWGDASANISIVLYTGMDNPYAKLLYPELKEIVTDSEGSVNLVYRHYPATTKAMDYPAAQVSECVAEQVNQEAFWKFTDAAIARSSLSVQILLEIAVSAGANENLVSACLEDGHTRDWAIYDKQRAALNHDINVSPSVVFFNHSTGETRVAAGLNTPTYLKEVLASMQ